MCVYKLLVNYSIQYICVYTLLFKSLKSDFYLKEINAFI